MAKPGAPEKARLLSIDVLRGCAALGVLITHAFPRNLTYLNAQAGWFRYLGAILSLGTLGVPLFFVISGFCIHLRWAELYNRVGDAKLDYLAFWKRRVRRLYPPYLVVLCLSMLIVVASYLAGRASFYPEPKLRWIGADFVAHLLMLHGFHPLLDVGAGNPPMWTLAREEYFYVLYFGLLAWRRAAGLIMTTAGVFVLGLIFPWAMRPIVPAGSTYWQIINDSALVLWIQWVLGMLAVESYYGSITLPRWSRAWWAVPVWLLAAGISLRYFWPLSTALLGMVFFTLINFCVHSERSHNWSTRRVLIWLSNVGIFSYSLYLVHYPVLWVFDHTWSVIARPPNVWMALAMTALRIVVGFFAAKLFFNLVERRFLNKPVKFRVAVRESIRIDQESFVEP